MSLIEGSSNSSTNVPDRAVMFDLAATIGLGLRGQVAQTAQASVSQNAALDVTALNPNLTFHVTPVTAVAKDSAAKAGQTDANLGATQAQTASVKADYMNAHRDQVAEFQSLMKAANGAEIANSVSGALFQPQSSDTMRAAVEVLDPTANLLSLYDAIATCNKEAKAPNSGEILEAIGKMQTLTAQIHQDAQTGVNQERADIPQPKVAWHNFTAEQIMTAMMRDVTKDPVMQRIEENERAIEGIAENKRYVDAHYDDNRARNPDKIAEALERRPDAFLSSAQGQELVTRAVITNQSLDGPFSGVKMQTGWAADLAAGAPRLAAPESQADRDVAVDSTAPKDVFSAKA